MSLLETLAWAATVEVCNVCPPPNPARSMKTTRIALCVPGLIVEMQPLPIACAGRIHQHKPTPVEKDRTYPGGET